VRPTHPQPTEKATLDYVPCVAIAPIDMTEHLRARKAHRKIRLLIGITAYNEEGDELKRSLVRGWGFVEAQGRSVAPSVPALSNVAPAFPTRLYAICSPADGYRGEPAVPAEGGPALERGGGGGARRRPRARRALDARVCL
jgi:CheY-like chemotaxis protein